MFISCRFRHNWFQIMISYTISVLVTSYVGLSKLLELSKSFFLNKMEIRIVCLSSILVKVNKLIYKKQHLTKCLAQCKKTIVLGLL